MFELKSTAGDSKVVGLEHFFFDSTFSVMNIRDFL